MLIDSQLFVIIARRCPVLYDLIPRGPQMRVLEDRSAEVAVNPRPLPPMQLGAAVATEFLQIVWLADHFGIGAKRVMDELDDWCPTVPKKLKLPPWWPLPVPDPDPEPNWLVEFHAGFVLRLTISSALSKKSPLRESLEAAVARSLDVIGSVKA